VTTASHVDWPQQARVIELVDNHDGTLSLFGTMIEHAASARVGRDAADVVGLAGLARELGMNDAGAGPERKVGSPADRNVELLLLAPFVRPTVPAGSTTSTTVDTAPAPAGAVPVGGSPSFTG
jgi:hypothetical protein